MGVRAMRRRRIEASSSVVWGHPFLEVSVRASRRAMRRGEEKGRGKEGGGRAMMSECGAEM